MNNLIRLLGLLALPYGFYAAWVVTASAVQPVTTTPPVSSCATLLVVIHHDRCLRVVKGTPHFDPGTPVAIVIQEDKR